MSPVMTTPFIPAIISMKADNVDNDQHQGAEAVRDQQDAERRPPVADGVDKGSLEEHLDGHHGEYPGHEERDIVAHLHRDLRQEKVQKRRRKRNRREQWIIRLHLAPLIP